MCVVHYIPQPPFPSKLETRVLRAPDRKQKSLGYLVFCRSFGHWKSEPGARGLREHKGSTVQCKGDEVGWSCEQWTGILPSASAFTIIAEGWTLALNFHTLARSAVYNSREKVEALELAGIMQTDWEHVNGRTVMDGRSPNFLVTAEAPRPLIIIIVSEHGRQGRGVGSSSEWDWCQFKAHICSLYI